jgi:hypothetical protein
MRQHNFFRGIIRIAAVVISLAMGFCHSAV